MTYRVLAYLLSLLLDLATLARRDARERELEILLLRHQLRILHRKVDPAVKTTDRGAIS